MGEIGLNPLVHFVIGILLGILYTILIYLFPSLVHEYGFVRLFTVLYLSPLLATCIYIPYEPYENITFSLPKICKAIPIVILTIATVGIMISKKYLELPNILYPKFDLHNFLIGLGYAILGVIVFLLDKLYMTFCDQTGCYRLWFFVAFFARIVIFFLMLTLYKYSFVFLHMLLIRLFG